MSDKRVKCPKCDVQVISKNLPRHLKQHSVECSSCSKSFPPEEKLIKHVLVHHQPHTSLKHTCYSCGMGFASFHKLQWHNRNVHGKIARIDTSPVDLTEFEHDQNLLEELQTVQHFLQNTKKELSRKWIYNYRLSQLEQLDSFIREKLDEIYRQLPCSVKLSISLGFVLSNIDDPSTYRYFYASENNPLLEHPMTISSRHDLAEIVSKIQKLDVMQKIISVRPDTKWKFYCVTNISFFSFLLKPFPLGCVDISLPRRLVKNRHIMCLLTDFDKKPYHDNLCMFRAIAYEINGSSNLAQDTMRLVSSFVSKTNQTMDNFLGVFNEQIPIIEEIVKTNIQLYSVAYGENDVL